MRSLCVAGVIFAVLITPVRGQEFIEISPSGVWDLASESDSVIITAKGICYNYPELCTITWFVSTLEGYSMVINSRRDRAVVKNSHVDTLTVFAECRISGSSEVYRSANLVIRRPVVPLCVKGVEPDDEDTDVATNCSLQWRCQHRPMSTIVFLDTVNPPVRMLGVYDRKVYDRYGYGEVPAGVLRNTATYYWKVVPVNEIGEAAGCPVWSFRTQGPVPPCPNILYPTDSTVCLNSPSKMRFSWSQQDYEDVTKYQIYLSDSLPLALLASIDLTWGPRNENMDTVLYLKTPLKPQTRYYYQIVSENRTGPALCETRSFMTDRPPSAPKNHWPPVGSVQYGSLDEDGDRVLFMSWSPPDTGCVENIKYAFSYRYDTTLAWRSFTVTDTSVMRYPMIQGNYRWIAGRRFYWTVNANNDFGSHSNRDTVYFILGDTTQTAVPGLHESQPEEWRISLYPMPLHDEHCAVVSSIPLTGGSVHLYDLLGRLVLERDGLDGVRHEIRMMNERGRIPAGMYILEVRTGPNVTRKTLLKN